MSVWKIYLISFIVFLVLFFVFVFEKPERRKHQKIVGEIYNTHIDTTTVKTSALLSSAVFKGKEKTKVFRIYSALTNLPKQFRVVLTDKQNASDLILMSNTGFNDIVTNLKNQKETLEKEFTAKIETSKKALEYERKKKKKRKPKTNSKSENLEKKPKQIIIQKKEPKILNKQKQIKQELSLMEIKEIVRTNSSYHFENKMINNKKFVLKLDLMTLWKGKRIYKMTIKNLQNEYLIISSLNLISQYKLNIPSKIFLKTVIAQKQKEACYVLVDDTNIKPVIFEIKISGKVFELKSEV